MIITIFGSETPTDKGYSEAYKLGKKIASKKHILKNGGYGGTMEASAKGVSELRGEVIGVCIKGNFAESRKPNKYLSKIIEEKNLGDRINELLKADAIIVLEGHIGTLEELFVAWAENAVNELHKLKTIPIYLVGRRNKLLLDFLIKNNFINKGRLHLVNYVDSMDKIEFLR